MELKGDKAIQQRLEKLAAQYPDATGAALYQEGLSIWRTAAKRVPVEHGVLRSSAYVGPPVRDAGGLSVEIGFGTKYAVFQEAREGLRHPRGGQAHYLGSALTEASAGFLERLGQRIEQNVARGVTAPALAAPTEPAVSGAGRRSSRPRLKKARKK